MKAVEKHLYNRKGYFYYRSSLPRYLHGLLSMREIVIGLNSQDLREARILAAQLNYNEAKAIQFLQYALKDESPDIFPERAVAECLDRLSRLKQSIGHESGPNTNHPAWNKQRGKQECGLLFSALCKKYMEDCVSDKQSTRHKKQTSYDLFIDLVGDLPLDQITAEHGRSYKTLLLRIPAHAKRDYKIENFKDIDWTKIKNGKPQHPKTINNRLACMIALFNWAIKADYYKAKNPISGLIISKAKQASSKYSPFTPDEIRAFYNAPIYTGCKGDKWADRFIQGKEIIKDSLYWVPLIGLYTGMRMNEICQLYVEDIKHENGIWFFDVNDDSKDKSLKTLSSRRRIPIHGALLKNDILDYRREMAEKKENRLFPDIPFSKEGNYAFIFSKRFARLLKAMQMKRNGLCFHSLRHNFIGDMRNTGVDRAVIMALVGHSATNDVHSGYGNGYTLPFLQRSINKLTYPQAHR